jgi:hypothetical protein
MQLAGAAYNNVAMTRAIMSDLLVPMVSSLPFSTCRKRLGGLSAQGRPLVPALSTSLDLTVTLRP